MIVRHFFIVSAILFCISAIFLDANHTAHWLNTNASVETMARIVDGVDLLKVLLFIDGFVLLFLFWWSKTHSISYSFPWWTNKASSGGISDRVFNLCLIALMTVGIVLRSITLNSDLWIDEVLTLVNYVRLDLGEILSNFTDDNQHMLYSVLAKISVDVFGESAAAIRFPAVLFGLGSIWATAHLVRYVFGKNEAIFSALLLTCSYHHVWFSQNARGYTILLFCTVVATELLLRGLATRQWCYWVGYATIIAMASWAHLTAVFVAIAHGIVLVLLGLRSLQAPHTKTWQWQPFLALGLAAWLTIHVYALVIPQLYDFFSQPGAGSSTRLVEWNNPFWLINEVLRNLGMGIAIGWVGMLIGCSLGVYGLIHVIKRDWLFTLLVLSPALLLSIVMIVLGRSLWPRMFFNELGFFAAIAVVGAFGIGELLTKLIRPGPNLVRLIPILMLCALFIISLPKVYQYPKQDYTGAREFVKAQRQIGDVVLGLHMAGKIYHRYYEPSWPEIYKLSEFNESEAQNGYTWVLYTLPSYIKSAHPIIQEKLEADYKIIRKFPGTLGDGEIIVRRSKNEKVTK